MVSPFQYMERISTGKLAEAATPKVSATRNATFCPSNRMPSTIAVAPIASVATFETRSSSCSDAFPLRMTLA